MGFDTIEINLVSSIDNLYFPCIHSHLKKNKVLQTAELLRGKNVAQTLRLKKTDKIELL